MMLHTKYQDSRPYGFRKEELFMFLLYARGVQYVMKTAQYISQSFIFTHFIISSIKRSVSWLNNSKIAVNQLLI